MPLLAAEKASFNTEGLRMINIKVIPSNYFVAV